MPFPLHLRFLSSLTAVLACPVLAWSQPQEKPVPVRNEPHHHVTFENDYLRMIDVHLPSGAQCVLLELK